MFITIYKITSVVCVIIPMILMRLNFKDFDCKIRDYFIYNKIYAVTLHYLKLLIISNSESQYAFMS